MKSRNALPLILGAGALALIYASRGKAADKTTTNGINGKTAPPDPEGDTSTFTDESAAGGTPDGVPLLGSDTASGVLPLPQGSPPLLSLGTSELNAIIQRQADLARALYLLGYNVRSDFQYSAQNPVRPSFMQEFAKDYNAVSRAMVAKNMKFMPEQSLGGGLSETGSGQSWQSLAGVTGALRYAWTNALFTPGGVPFMEVANEVFDGSSFLRRFLNRGRSVDMSIYQASVTREQLYRDALSLARSNWRPIVSDQWKRIVSRYTNEGFRNL